MKVSIDQPAFKPAPPPAVRANHSTIDGAVEGLVLTVRAAVMRQIKVQEAVNSYLYLYRYGEASGAVCENEEINHARNGGRLCKQELR